MFLHTGKHCAKISRSVLDDGKYKWRYSVYAAHLLERARSITLLSPIPHCHAPAVNLSRWKRTDNIAWPNHHGNFSIPALFIGSLNAPSDTREHQHIVCYYDTAKLGTRDMMWALRIVPLRRFSHTRSFIRTILTTCVDLPVEYYALYARLG